MGHFFLLQQNYITSKSETKKWNHLVLIPVAINVMGSRVVVTQFLITAYFSLFPSNMTLLTKLCYGSLKTKPIKYIFIVLSGGYSTSALNSIK